MSSLPVHWGGGHIQHTRIPPIGSPPKAWNGAAGEAHQCDAPFSKVASRGMNISEIQTFGFHEFKGRGS